MKRWSLYLLWPVPFVLCAVTVLWPVLTHMREAVVGAPSAPFADALTMFYPLRAFANGELQHGRLPLWNPYILCGHAQHGEGQAAIFYPLNLLLAPLSPQMSMNVFALTHFAAAGVFFSLYLRACGLRRFSAFLGGFVYMFSSVPISRLYAGHYTIIPFVALVPALMWVWEAWRKTGGWEKAAWGGIVVGAMILAGYPQLVLYATLYLGVHALIESGARLHGHRGAAAVVPLGYWGAVLGVGACIGAVQLLPSYAFALESFRHHVAYDTIATFSFSPENLVTLLLPHAFGNLGDGIAPYWGRNLLWENWIYIGVVPLVLAVTALLRVRTRLVTAHGLAVPVFLVLALGKHTPLHRFLYDHVPFFSFFRGSSKFSFFVVISLAALAGIGFNRLLHDTDLERQKSLRRTVAATLGVFAAAGLVLGLIFGAGPTTDGSALSRFVRWRFAQGETYLLPDAFSGADLPLIRDQALRQVTRLVSLTLLALIIVAYWPGLRKRYWLSCAALCLAVLPDVVPFVAGESLRAPVDASAFDSKVLAELRRDQTRLRLLAPDLARNALVPYRVESPLGYVGNMTKRYNNFLTAVNGVERSALMVETPVVREDRRLLWPAVSHLMVDAQARVPESVATPLVQGRDRVLYRVNDPRPRAAFSRAVATYGSAEDALSALEAGAVDLSLTDMVELPDGPLRPAFDPPAPGDKVAILESLPMKTVIRTKASGPRLLVLADSFASGWRCRLDGRKELTIYPVNVAFRGVPVPEGDHTLTFSYEPTPFYVGAGISALAVLGVLIGPMLLLARRRPRSAPR